MAGYNSIPLTILQRRILIPHEHNIHEKHFTAKLRWCTQHGIMILCKGILYFIDKIIIIDKVADRCMCYKLWTWFILHFVNVLSCLEWKMPWTPCFDITVNSLLVWTCVCIVLTECFGMKCLVLHLYNSYAAQDLWWVNILPDPFFTNRAFDVWCMFVFCCL